MLRIIEAEPLIENLISINKDRNIDEIDNNSKVVGIKFQGNSQAKLAKSNNIIRPDFLDKSKLLVEISSKSGFFILKVRLAFAKLRQAFSQPSILYHFNPKYHICVETDTSSYIISEVLIQLTLDNLS